MTVTVGGSNITFSDSSTQSTSYLAASSNSSGSGYVKFGNGLVIQWGSTTTNGTGTITFPIAFPTAVTSVTLGTYGNSDDNNNPSPKIEGTPSTTSMVTRNVLNTNTTGAYTYWTAIGY